MKLLHVKGLTEECNQEVLQEAFGRHGTVLSVTKAKPKQRYAHIEFIDAKGANAAMLALQGQELNGAKLNIALALRPQQDYEADAEQKHRLEFLHPLDPPSLPAAAKSSTGATSLLKRLVVGTVNGMPFAKRQRMFPVTIPPR